MIRIAVQELIRLLYLRNLINLDIYQNCSLMLRIDHIGEYRQRAKQ
ncbi:MAG TPA: hypothetical protein [Caudoviricetes sp.]|nr:MAG TPA: hypothetical protein [Caudoviricetes sp.]